MRILIYGINFAPEPTGIGKYTAEMAASLEQSGCEVRVLTAPMYYPAWKTGPGFSALCYQVEQSDNVLVTRCPIYVPRRTSGIRRCIHLMSFAISSFAPLMYLTVSWRPDVIFVVAPSLLCAPGAWLAGKFSGARLWLHYQDLEIDAALAMKLLPRRGIGWLAKSFERWIIRRFDTLSTISSRMLEKLQAKGVSKQIRLLPNWVDTLRIKPAPRNETMRRRLGIHADAIVALYSGSINEKSGLETIIESARKLSSNSRLTFVVCGDGPARERIKGVASGLNNVIFLPLQPQEQFNDLLNIADIHLLPQQPGAADLVMPSKLAAILSAGGAVVAAAGAGTEIDCVLNQIEGVVCASNDASAWAPKIEELANNFVGRKEMGERARHYAIRHFDKDTILTGLAHQLLNGKAC